MVPNQTTKGRILILVTFVLLLCTVGLSNGQAPESLAGLTLDLSVTEKSSSKLGNRQDYRMILNENGDAYIMGIRTDPTNPRQDAGEPEWRFTYESSRTTSSKMRMIWMDGTSWSVSFGEYGPIPQPPDNTDLSHAETHPWDPYTTFSFENSLAGSYETTTVLFPGGPQFERGVFKAYNGTAPASFAHKVAPFYVPNPIGHFGTAGLYYMYTDAQYLTIANSAGTTIYSASYLYKVVNKSSGMLTLLPRDSMSSQIDAVIALTFGDGSSGNLIYHDPSLWTNGTFAADFYAEPIPAPTIFSQPQSQSIGVGQPATMSVVANGLGTLTYQWVKDGIPLPHGTNSSLSIPSVQLWHAGTYWVIVSNVGGHALSSSVTLTPVCGYNLVPGYVLLNYPGGTRQINVSATGTCPWTASTTNNWIQITSGSSGEGNGIVQFSVAPNDTTEPRNGSITIAGKTFVVAQRGDLVRTNIAGKTLLLTFESGYGDQAATGAFVASHGGTSFRFVPRSTNLTELTGSYQFTKTSVTNALLDSELLDAVLSYTNATSGTFTGTNHLGNPATGHFRLYAIAPDFNHDAYTDLVFQNTNAVLASWFMEGTSFLENSLLRNGIPLAANQRAFALADFNNDGQTDIVLRSTEGCLGVWLMNGTERLSAIVLRDGITAPAWRAFSTTDLRGEGRHDILFQHQDGRLAAWHFEGTNFVGGTSLRRGQPLGPDWRAVGTGDFNGDLQSDLLLQHTSGKIAVGWMNAGDFVGAENLRPGWTPPTGLRVVATGDFNGDGRVDILWQNIRNQLVIWIMNGKTFVSAMYLRDGTPVGPQWKPIGPK